MATRKDNKGRVLKAGERQKPNGTYEYRVTLKNGKRKSIFGTTLAELRDREKEFEKTASEGIQVDASKVTVDDMFNLWKKVKRGLRSNTYIS